MPFRRLLERNQLRVDGDVAYVTLTQGHVALIDAADAALVSPFRWYAWKAPHGQDVWYARTNIPKGPDVRPILYMHTLILGVRGIDHRNHDGLDNRRANLRAATVSQNAANQRRRAGNVTGYKGVGYRKRNDRRCRYWARIRMEGRVYFLGWFFTAEEAARAYDAAALIHHGSFACLNFPFQQSA